MKTPFGVLLAAALLTDLAYSDSFRCYTCKRELEEDNANCLVPTDCLELQKCQTIVSSDHGKRLISKRCVFDCVRPTDIANVTSLECCNGNLCNLNLNLKSNGATSAPVSFTALSLAVGVVVCLLG